jgi:uncharacterized protein YcbK (DUF882 family)
MRYFEPSEFTCKCGCGKAIMDPVFLTMLEKAREIADTPFHITSGYRCPKHNSDVGSTSSNHTSGKASDITAESGPVRGKILKGLYKAGFDRVGIGKDFIHADITDSVESCWLY